MNQETSQEKTKELILKEALKIIPFQGWSLSTLEEAGKKAGFAPKAASLIFIDGVNGLLDLYLDHIDKKMLEAVNNPEFHQLKIRDRIFEAIKARIKILAKEKTVTIKTVTYLAAPWRIPMASKLVWRTIDIIWREMCGDQSTDFNYYTKRSLLYGVYTSTIVYWLSDTSDGYSDTFDFLRRRIENVLKAGAFINKIKTLPGFN